MLRTGSRPYSSWMHTILNCRLPSFQQHKHSLSHNFFSFLDPTVTNPNLSGSSSDTSPADPNQTPHNHSATPRSVPTTFVSGAPTSGSLHASSSSAALLPSPSMQITPTRSRTSVVTDLNPLSQLAIGFSIAEFFLGASIWVEGQASGSVGLTGLGYMVVFDAMGMGTSVAGELMKLGLGGMSSIRRPFG